jgi:energy-coupling factor transporter ATP-binding protein EcfA2
MPRLSNAELATHVAGDGWLGSYLDYARPLTKAPSLYHLATGLACLSVACGSKVSWWTFGNQEVWPNLYVLLLGDSGVGKTTASNIGTNMLRHAIPGAILADNFSAEALIKSLVEHPSSMVYAEEFATLLASSKKEFNGGVRELLTQLYDSRDSYNIIRTTKEAGGNQTIFRPSVGLFGGSTVVWLTKHLGEVDFQTGFMARVLMFHQNDQDCETPAHLASVGNTRESPEYIELAKGLRKIGVMQHRATVMFDDKVSRYQQFWELALAGDTLIATTPDMRGMVMRLTSTAYKIAALLAVADYGVQERYVVDLPMFKRSTVLVEWLVRQTAELFTNHIVFEDFEKNVQSIVSFIPDEGIPRHELLALSRTNVGDFDRMINTMIQRREVELVQIQPEDDTKSVPHYRRIYKPVSSLAVIDAEIDDEPEIEEQVEMPDE